MAIPRASSWIGVSGSRHCRVEIDHPPALVRTVDEQTALYPRALRHRLQRCVAFGGRGDEDLRLAVFEDVGQFVRGQIRVDAGLVEAGAFASAAAFNIARVGSP